MSVQKLIKLREIEDLLATCYRVDGSDRLVLELHIFGPAYSSYFLLLRSASALDDPEIVEQIGRAPTRFGRKLVFGRDLERDPATDDVYFVDEGDS
jgi:hypothetical protein